MSKYRNRLWAMSFAAFCFIASAVGAADNSSVPVAVGNETFANKDIGGVKFPKHILYNSSGTEVGTAAAPLFMQSASGAFASGSFASGSVSAGAYAAGALAAGAFATGAGVDGWDLTQGAIADVAASAGGTGTLSAKLRLMTTQLGTINTTLGSPFQAGGSIANTTFAATQATSSNLKAQVDPLTPASWAIGATAASVPANAHYWGINISGNQVGVTGLALGATTKAPTVAIVDASGNQITAFGGSGGTASNYGSAFPTAGTAIGMSDGTNMVAMRSTAYGTTPTGLNAMAVNAFVTNTNANGQAAAASSSPVVVAKNSGTGSTVAGAAVGTAGSASAEVVTVQGVASGTPLLVSSSDPCLGANKTNLAISQNGTASVQLIALSGATVVYVCSLSLIAAGATTVALTTGTGAACVTGTAAVIGSTTVANSVSLAANGGLTLGNGAGTVAKGAASSELCMVLGTSVFVSGNLTYVQQ